MNKKKVTEELCKDVSREKNENHGTEGALKEECWKVSMKDRNVRLTWNMRTDLWCRGKTCEYAVAAGRKICHA